jgi:hypothetical protein
LLGCVRPLFGCCRICCRFPVGCNPFFWFGSLVGTGFVPGVSDLYLLGCNCSSYLFLMNGRAPPVPPPPKKTSFQRLRPSQERAPPMLRAGARMGAMQHPRNTHQTCCSTQNTPRLVFRRRQHPALAKPRVIPTNCCPDCSCLTWVRRDKS